MRVGQDLRRARDVDEFTLISLSTSIFWLLG